MTRWHLFTLASAFAVVCGCAKTPAKSTAKPASDGVSVAKERQLAGSYDCRLEIADETFSGTCTVARSDAGFQLTMQGSERYLNGALEGTEPGFHFTGTIQCKSGDCTEPVETDFFAQDPGTFSGVFALEAGSLVNAHLEIRQ